MQIAQILPIPPIQIHATVFLCFSEQQLHNVDISPEAGDPQRIITGIFLAPKSCFIDDEIAVHGERSLSGGGGIRGSIVGWGGSIVKFCNY
jgi:hypothetical protein